MKDKIKDLELQIELLNGTILSLIKVSNEQEARIKTLEMGIKKQ